MPKNVVSIEIVSNIFYEYKTIKTYIFFLETKNILQVIILKQKKNL